MSFLFCMPGDVVGVVLASWLDLTDVAHLDSAMCVRQERTAFLTSTYGASAAYDYAPHFDKVMAKKAALFYTQAFQKWVLLRRVRLSSLASFPKCVKLQRAKKGFMEIIRRSGSCLKTVKTDLEFDIVKEALITHSKALERLDCGGVGANSGLDRLLRACPSLHHLSFEYYDASVPAMLQEFGSQIQSLWMGKGAGRELPLPLWVPLIPYLPNLREAVIAVWLPADTILIALGQHCPHLRVLSVQSAPCLSGRHTAALQTVARGCPQLTQLRITANIYIEECGLLELLGRCRHLTALRLGEGAYVTEAVMAVLARDFPALRELEVRPQCKDIWFSEHFRCWPLLEDFNTGRGQPVSDEFLHALGACCPRLRAFVAPSCHRVTDAGLAAFTQACTQLKLLELGYCDSITVAALEATVTNCRYLERLTIQQGDAPAVRISREEAAPYLALKLLGDINFYRFPRLKRRVGNYD